MSFVKFTNTINLDRSKIEVVCSSTQGKMSTKTKTITALVNNDPRERARVESRRWPSCGPSPYFYNRIVLARNYLSKEEVFQVFVGMSNQTATKLFNNLAHIALSENPAMYATLPQEIDSLLSVVTLKGRGVDVCSGTGSISKYLESRLSPTCPIVYNIDIVNRGLHVKRVVDILEYDLVHDSFDFLIFSPPFEQSDAFITWALRQNLDVTCIHLSGGWESVDYRYRLVLRLAEEGRLIKIRAGKNVWIVIFKNPDIMNEHVATGSLTMVPCV